MFEEHKSRVVTFGLVGDTKVISGSVDGEVLLWDRTTEYIQGRYLVKGLVKLAVDT